ncbi:MAG: hypothetical protein ACLUVP_06500, partial [Acutalibacter sp.]
AENRGHKITGAHRAQRRLRGAFRDVKFFAQLSFKKEDAGKLKIADTKLPVPTGRSGGSAPRSAT